MCYLEVSGPQHPSMHGILRLIVTLGTNLGAGAGHSPLPRMGWPHTWPSFCSLGSRRDGDAWLCPPSGHALWWDIVGRWGCVGFPFGQWRLRIMASGRGSEMDVEAATSGGELFSWLSGGPQVAVVAVLLGRRAARGCSSGWPWCLLFCGRGSAQS